MYTIRYSQEVKAFFAPLCDDDKKEIRHLLDGIQRHPEYGRTVDSVPGVLYQKADTLDKARWRAGIRVFYVVKDDIEIIGIVDLGDHTRCASCPDDSIYPDERRRKSAVAA